MTFQTDVVRVWASFFFFVFKLHYKVINLLKYRINQLASRTIYFFMTKHIKFGLKVKLWIIYEVLEYIDYSYEYTTMYKVYYKAL